MSTFDYVLGITDYSGSTVTLTSSPFAIMREGYEPMSAPESVPELDEEIRLRVTDGSVANNLDELRTLRALLLQAAREKDNRTLNRVYLFFKESASADEYRSLIMDGSATWEASTLDRDTWEGNTQFVNVEITRANWWEGPEAQLPLTNANGTDNTSGLTVYNTNDEDGTSPNKRVNYVEIDGVNDVAGELDGPMRLEITNTFATNRLYFVWIGQNYTDPTNCVWFFDANDATGGTAQTDSGWSGGNYNRVTIAGSAEYDLFTWTLTSAQLDAFAGRTYKALIHHAIGPQEHVRLRLVITWRGIVVWQSSLISLDGSIYSGKIREITTLKMPPWIAGLSNMDSLDLTIKGYHTSASAQIDYDALYLVPADGWRFIAWRGYGIVQNGILYDDGIDDRLYADYNGGGTAIAANIAGYGRAIKVRPGVLNRMYFKSQSHLNAVSDITRTMSIKAYYRPRRLSL